jgi:DNA-damage-inducible protein D
MDASQIQGLTSTFEGHAQQTETGVEYWLARDLQQLLGYAKWENFLATIAKAKTACEVSGHPVENHFPDVRKMVRIGSGTEREIEDIMLTRYACYLIAQNGDPRSLPAPERLHKLNDIAISQMRSLLTDHHIKRLAS